VDAALKIEGFKSRIFETFRTRERAVWLGQRGKSKSGFGSMHCLHAATDFIDANLGWSNPAFFAALGRIGQAYGLTWGGDWDSNPETNQSFNDRPHLQAIPLGMQNLLRRLRTFESRERIVAAYLDKHPMPAAWPPPPQIAGC